MNKKVSLLIALVMSVGISSTTFAADTTTTSNGTNITITQSATGTINLTLVDALNSIESNNTTIKLLDQKIKLTNRQYDDAHQKALEISTSGKSAVNYSGDSYAGVKIQETVTPLQASQNVEYAKHDKETKLKDLKLSLENYYMDALNCEDQIKNINSTIENIDKQIKQTEAKIAQGTETSDAVDSLNLQKSQKLATLNTPKAQIQQDILNIKQILNIDLNSDVVLAPVTKDFAKYDDSKIEEIINTAAENIYSIHKANNNIQLLKMQADIYAKYYYVDNTNVLNSQLNLQDAQNTLQDTIIQNKITLWQAYYAAKNYEDNIATAQVSVQNAQTKYDNTLAKFNLGQVDKLQVDSAKLALDSEKITLQKAINDYMVNVQAFINQLTQ